jgi:hypothetical protein
MYFISKTTMKSALEQIEDRRYASEFQQAGVQKIFGTGVGVHHKKNVGTVYPVTRKNNKLGDFQQ